MDDNAIKGKKQHLIAKSRALKDGKTIPNLVFKIEAFERDIIKLTKRCNIDLFGSKYPKISTSRDFRVKAKTTEESMVDTVINDQVQQNDPSVMNDSEVGSETDEVSISNSTLNAAYIIPPSAPILPINLCL